MEKYIVILLMAGLFMACSKEAEQTDLPSAVEETVELEAVEQSVERLEEELRSSGGQIEAAQNEVDELLNGI
ncbi:MAG: hypothetical protein EA363_00380 [Balneolaceae bacterium]|nr:MAG: hypothetical protein EA363_00380 [Balneolaceae bacterium]